jgi:hypothetical protein
MRQLCRLLALVWWLALLGFLLSFGTSCEYRVTSNLASPFRGEPGSSNLAAFRLASASDRCPPRLMPRRAREGTRFVDSSSGAHVSRIQSLGKSSELNRYPGGDIPKPWEESFRIENRVHVRVTSQSCLFRLGLVPSGIGCLSCYLATLFWRRPFPSGLSADLPALTAESSKQCSHAFGQSTTFLGLAHEQQSSCARRPHASC